MILYSEKLDEYLREHFVIAQPLRYTDRYQLDGVYWDEYWNKTYRVLKISFLQEHFIDKVTGKECSKEKLHEVSVLWDDGNVKRHSVAFDRKNDYVLVPCKRNRDFDIFDGKYYTTEEIKLWCILNQDNALALKIVAKYMIKGGFILIPFRRYKCKVEKNDEVFLEKDRSFINTKERKKAEHNGTEHDMTERKKSEHDGTECKKAEHDGTECKKKKKKKHKKVSKSSM